MSVPYLAIRPGHPDFLDLDWGRSVAQWDGERVVELPAGVHRHPLCFVAYGERIYAIKELPRWFAHHEYDTLRTLQGRLQPIATPIGVVERRWVPPDEEWSGAVITEYVSFAFTYRELLSGWGFGARRAQMLDAFAGLLVELHLAGCYWGDCSLSNVLYRYDADTIEAIMIDAETAELHDSLSNGQRLADLEIMEVNVAGGMADIAASQGIDLDDADLALGADISRRYARLWDLLTKDVVLGRHERYRIRERIARLNTLGFEVDDVELRPDGSGGDRLKMRVRVGGRSYHSARLRELTRIRASENQARQILSDLHYYEAGRDDPGPVGKDVSAIQWRVRVFEPLLARIRGDLDPEQDAVQAYCDFLHHRYMLATEQQRDVPNDEAYAHWLEAGKPGYPLDEDAPPRP
jgi:hypothetical protein